MFGSIKTVDDVKKKIKADNFDNLTDKQKKKLQKTLVKADKCVVLDVMKEMSNYVEFCKEFVIGMKNFCNDMIANSEYAEKSAIEGYQKILNALEKELDKPRLSRRKKDKITNQMLMVAKCISEEGDKHRNFINGILKNATTIGTSVFALVGSVFAIVLSRRK